MAPQLFSRPSRVSRPSRTSRPILCVVLDGPALGRAPETLALDLFEAGVDWIQLRDRSASSLELTRFAQSLVAARNQATDTDGLRVIINRRVDLALCSDADGVHLGFDALAENHARSLLPEGHVLGGSFHSIEEVETQASRTDAILAYAHLAPIWDPLSKKASRPALGIALLEKACAIGLPILAQGGVDPARAEQAVAAGAAGIAVTGIITGARNPTLIARQLREGLDRALDA